MRFVASTRLSDDESGQPTAARLHDLLDRRPDLEFKLDPTSAWTDDLVAEVAATGAVRVVDLKGQYDGTIVDQPPDPDLYERVVGGFPDAVVEDPAVTPATRPVVERVADRLA